MFPITWYGGKSRFQLRMLAGTPDCPAQPMPSANASENQRASEQAFELCETGLGHMRVILFIAWEVRADRANVPATAIEMMACGNCRRYRQQPTQVVPDGSTEVGEPVVTTMRGPTRTATVPLRGSGSAGRRAHVSTPGS